MSVRTIAVVTTSRADYGIYLPVLRGISAEPRLSLRLLVSGTHLSERFGLTIREIEADGFVPAECIPLPLESDAPAAVASAMAASTDGFARAFDRSRPDVLLVLGDRFEMHAAAVAAVPFRIPVAHIHGGEQTMGAIDDVLRHSMTKLSHLHFPATAEYARRIQQMGEEPWRVHIAGAPALDNLATFRTVSAAELHERFGVDVSRDTLIVTYHPATQDSQSPEAQAEELVAALEASGRPVVVTMPNADPGGLIVRSCLAAFAERYSQARIVESLGTDAYFTLLAHAGAMVGNSSSGIIEAPSFELPVVNIGPRQDGRTRGANVIDVPCNRAAIGAAIARASDAGFRASLRGAPNPYGDGGAAGRIVARLRDVELSPRLLVKHFIDLPVDL